MNKIFLGSFIALFFLVILSENLLASEHQKDEATKESKPQIIHDPLGGIDSFSSFQQFYPLNVSEPNRRQSPLYSSKMEINVAVVVDAFRAFTTACYVLEQHPATYRLMTKSAVVSRLASNLSNPVLIGKPEIGAILAYDIPNSPTRVKDVKITNQNVLHRTEAGAKGILLAQGSDIILAAGFINADATVAYIKTLPNPKVKIVPMGHEAKSPSLEDDVCTQYINALLCDQTFNLTECHTALREGPGSYFFGDDQWQYPSKDFKRCLKIGRFNFAIQAEVRDDYAILRRCN